jgi:hypothetical protein
MLGGTFWITGSHGTVQFAVLSVTVTLYFTEATSTAVSTMTATAAWPPACQLNWVS